jgi:hypothetical protein
MKRHVFFVILFIAGALFGSPVKGLAADYCYMGSIVDDTTDEILDLYGMCADDSDNLDLA